VDLIDRYLNAVRGFLPASQQGDIIRELEEDIRSQAADLEEELGRPLTDEDAERLLERYGHPVRLAARYRPERQLIGPAIFPFYWLVLKIALSVALAVHVVIAAVTLVTGSAVGEALVPVFVFPFTVGVTVFGWVTLVFAVVDRNLDQFAGAASWKDGTLPQPFAERVRSRLALLCEIAASTAFLIWWLAVPQAPFLAFGPAAAFLGLGPIWHTMYPVITAVWVGSLAVMWAILLRPGWGRYRAHAGAVGNLLALAIAVVLLRSGPLVTLVDPALASEGTLTVTRVVNVSVQIGLGVFAAVCVWELGAHLLRLSRGRLAAS
jgi:hypothetical protein